MSLRVKAKLHKKYPYLHLIKEMVYQTKKGRIAWDFETRPEDKYADRYIAVFPSFRASLDNYDDELYFGDTLITEDLLGPEADLLKKLIGLVKSEDSDSKQCSSYIKEVRKGSITESEHQDTIDNIYKELSVANLMKAEMDSAL